MGWVVTVTTRPRFIPEERVAGTHRIGGWVGLSAGLDIETREKYEGNSKSKVPYFYLNNITTYRVTHDPEIHSRIIFTSLDIHQVCLDTYHGYISIRQILYRK
jgi:hypothetical protein